MTALDQPDRHDEQQQQQQQEYILALEREVPLLPTWHCICKCQLYYTPSHGLCIIRCTTTTGQLGVWQGMCLI